jgi:IS5 family transposase
MGVELGHDPIPDETTILNFRHLLERHNLTEALFEAVKSALKSGHFCCAAARLWTQP